MDENLIDNFYGSIFYLLGFAENPAEEQAKEVLQDTPGEKIRKDVSKVNTSLKDSFVKLREKALLISE